MKENEIYFNIPNDEYFLIGKQCGKEDRMKYLRKMLKDDTKNIIIIPDTVTHISISYINGLIGPEIKKYKPNELNNHIELKTNYASLEQNIQKSLDLLCEMYS